ncbi:hypothetical protein L596_006642 [Steinernema carpocapsae]|uniref:Uncharacterized protein n=1 Tax=Steinernema carpocapsae TaxID=34508 RepID=A0A4U8V5M2_STECR|nr:hypothetical protein L596_006642 [Steinernema carpocapsae]
MVFGFSVFRLEKSTFLLCRVGLDQSDESDHSAETFETDLFERTTVKTVFEMSDDEAIHDDTDSESHNSTEHSSLKSSLEDVTALRPLSLDFPCHCCKSTSGRHRRDFDIF